MDKWTTKVACHRLSINISRLSMLVQVPLLRQLAMTKDIEYINDYGLLTAKPCMYAINMNKLLVLHVYGCDEA